ncbi:MAG: hypothetical protein QOH56_2796 [Pseudonocardiales bacterium]|jgi:hypothetical protein|nr:hypothetical protein [Pseudonocardiales bacterium]
MSGQRALELITEYHQAVDAADMAAGFDGGVEVHRPLDEIGTDFEAVLREITATPPG